MADPRSLEGLLAAGHLTQVELHNGAAVLRSAKTCSLEALATRLDDELRPIFDAPDVESKVMRSACRRRWLGAAQAKGTHAVSTCCMDMDGTGDICE